MSAVGWLAARTPPAPAELRAHMAGLAAAADRTGSALPDVLATAGEAAFARVLEAGAASRDSALDLLSADAFVTYAFEAAADEPGTIAARADAMMRRVSAMATARLGGEAR